MPDSSHVVAHGLPLTAAVDLVRPLVIGQWPSEGLGPPGVLAAYAISGHYLALVLTRRRFFS
jgi:lipooligosaccharide transport system permease protein